jgi:hypothetical protein
MVDMQLLPFLEVGIAILNSIVAASFNSPKMGEKKSNNSGTAKM